MRLRLSDGTVIDSSMLNGTSLSSSRRHENAPSKRQVKQGGGTLKRLHSRQSGYVTSQGRLIGSRSVTKGMYQDMEMDPETGEYVRTVPRNTAIVVNAAKRRFTWNVGGSCSTGYIGGRGA